jgi:hypothetical protein
LESGSPHEAPGLAVLNAYRVLLADHQVDALALGS